jgi:hypothetical protein
VSEEENGFAVFGVDAEKGFKSPTQCNINSSVFLKAAENRQDATLSMSSSLSENTLHCDEDFSLPNSHECLEVGQYGKALIRKATFEAPIVHEFFT